VPLPAAEPGRIQAAAVAAVPVGAVQPVAVAMTNGRTVALRLEARQVYAHAAEDGRTAPLPPGEAARLAGGRRVPGAVRGGVVGAASGGALGAAGGAISGAIQGGVGLATAAGAAVGAFFGAVAGVLGGGRATPDVAGFTDRALQDATLAPGFSATGYVYYPAGTYRMLEILLTDDAGAVEWTEVTIDAAP
jgi:hypothetical protein